MSLSELESSDSKFDVAVEIKKNIWMCEKNKIKRMRGESYTATKKDDNGKKIKITRPARQIGPRCNCKIKTNRCHEFTDEDRLKLFKNFWSLSWTEKTQLVATSINKHSVEKESGNMTRSFNTYLLPQGNIKQKVCKVFFSSTLDIGNEQIKRMINVAKKQKRTIKFQHVTASEIYFKKWLEKIPKMENHYCRNSTSKLYIHSEFNSLSEFYREYKKAATLDDKIPYKLSKFRLLCKQNKVSIYNPKKDLCDKCVAFKCNQLSLEDYNKHITNNQFARDAKQTVKQYVLDGLAYGFQINLHTVKLLPKIYSNKSYYNEKLQVYNYTIYELATKNCWNYWFTEIDSNLEASTFASILIAHLEKYAILRQNIYIISDGCGYQNRNNVLSNALLRFATKKKITIEHLYLEPGHTQMECDDIHSLIERNLKGKSIYVPDQYVRICEAARKIPNPLIAELLDYTFFKNYDMKKVYNSIRPGSKSDDAKVKDIRVLKYESSKIYFKLSHSQEDNNKFKILPSKRTKCDLNFEFPQLNSRPLKLNEKKCNDLISMKEAIPSEYHYFYNKLLSDVL